MKSITINNEVHEIDKKQLYELADKYLPKSIKIHADILPYMEELL